MFQKWIKIYKNSIFNYLWNVSKHFACTGTLHFLQSVTVWLWHSLHLLRESVGFRTMTCPTLSLDTLFNICSWKVDGRPVWLIEGWVSGSMVPCIGVCRSDVAGILVNYFPSGSLFGTISMHSLWPLPKNWQIGATTIFFPLTFVLHLGIKLSNKSTPPCICYSLILAWAEQCQFFVLLSTETLCIYSWLNLIPVCC